MAHPGFAWGGAHNFVSLQQRNNDETRRGGSKFQPIYHFARLPISLPVFPIPFLPSFPFWGTLGEGAQPRGPSLGALLIFIGTIWISSSASANYVPKLKDYWFSLTPLLQSWTSNNWWSKSRLWVIITWFTSHLRPVPRKFLKFWNRNLSSFWSVTISAWSLELKLGWCSVE